MNVLVLQVFVSLMLVAGAVLLFVYSVRHRDFEHADRLSLLPLEPDANPSSTFKSTVPGGNQP
jgi:hypothetical protein